MATYVTANLNGNTQAFDQLLATIKLNKRDTLYVLGDVLGYTENGITLLQRIMEMNNAKMCIGNYEYDFLRYIGYPYMNEKPTNRDYYIFRKINLSGDNIIVRPPIMLGEELIYGFNNLPLQDRTKIIFYLRSLPVEYRISIKSKNDEIMKANPGLKICSKSTAAEYKWHYQLAHASTSFAYLNAKARHHETNPATRFDEFGEFCTNNTEYCDEFELKTTLVVAHTPDRVQYDIHSDRIIKVYTDRYKSMNIPSIEKVISLECHPNPSVCRKTIGCIRLDDMEEFYVK